MIQVSTARWIGICFMIMTIACSGERQDKTESAKTIPDQGPGLHPEVTGEWLRTDGNYVLNIQRFNPDSTLNAIYLNPRPINIAETRWKVQDNYIYFYVKFDDQGYPGSYYSLGYLPEEDKLYGLYYQAVMGQEFEVIFERKY